MSCIDLRDELQPSLRAGPVIITGTLHTDARSFLRRADIVSMRRRSLSGDTGFWLTGGGRRGVGGGGWSRGVEDQFRDRVGLRHD